MTLLTSSTATPADPVRMSERRFMSLDGVHAEWVNGYTYFMSPVSVEHDDLRVWLLGIISELCEVGGLGKVHSEPFVAKLNDTTIRSPDLMFLSTPTTHRLERNRLNGALDLVIEIVSPESVSRDYRDKFSDYQSAGVAEYWIVDPVSRVFEVHRRSRAGKFAQVQPDASGRVHSKTLPGFFFDLKWLKPPLPRRRTILKEMGIS